MKKLVRAGALLLGACLVWAAGAKADSMHILAANTGDEARSFVAGGEDTEARENSAARLSLISSGSEDRSNVLRQAFGTHGETIWTVFHHSDGDGDNDNDNGGAGGSSSNGQSNGGTATGSGGGGAGVVSTPEPSSLLLLAVGLLGLLSSTKKALRTKTA